MQESIHTYITYTQSYKYIHRHTRVILHITTGYYITVTPRLYTCIIYYLFNLLVVVNYLLNHQQYVRSIGTELEKKKRT